MRQCSERKMEGEDSVRTVDCLRGRLLAERAASKDAKEEAQLLENKLMELEKLLKQEAKSRNKAEKKLKFLMKKLESINTCHLSDESEYISSTPSSITKQEQGGNRGHFENQELNTFQKDFGNLNSSSDDSSTISSAFEAHFPESRGLGCEMGRGGDATSPRIGKNVEQRNATFEDSSSSASDEKSSSNLDQESDLRCCNINTAKQRNATFEDSSSSASDEKSSSNLDQESGFCCHSIRSSADEEVQDSDTQVDDSMALVLVDTSRWAHRVDPGALDATVREVLDTLRRAKEQLRSSMERRRMKVIGVAVEASSSTISI